MRSGIRIALSSGLLLPVLLFSAGWSAAPATAQTRAAAPEVGSAVAPAVRSVEVPDSRRLAAFFDSEVPGLLNANHVPGAAISVVRDGTTVFSKGYGWADVERKTVFDPETSLVRIASISKLFTWTAVMQLVQDGRLDLHQDVNHYLTAFKIPNTFARPITLEDLMNHTAGFEERTIGVGARRKADVPPLGTYLAEHMPARVRPPGEMTAYSNYGAALAGYIVAQVSGQPYEQYVQDHIFGPLAMRHSTAFEPVPASLAATQAHSYEYENGAYQRIPFVFDKLVPDGSTSTTADDLTRFMIAHLQDGRLGDVRILNDATARLMHQRSFAADPRIDGYAHGFKEMVINGHRAIMHDGSWEGFQSVLILVPDQRLGLFISMNSEGGIDAATTLMDDFFDRFIPPSSVVPESSVVPKSTAIPKSTLALTTRLAGFYQPARHTESTVGKLLTLTGSSRVRFAPDGQLKFQNKAWAPIGPRLYQQVGGTARATFVTTDDATYLATDAGAYQRVPRLATVPVNLVVLLVFVLMALTVVLGWPLVFGVRKWRKRPSTAPKAWRRARLFAGLGALVGLIFVVLLTLTLIGDTSEFLYAAPLSFRALLVLPLVFVVLTVTAVVTTASAWRLSPIGVLTRVHQTLFLAGLFVLVWFCWQWNLFGWRLG